jgi:hypothetical protein
MRGLAFLAAAASLALGPASLSRCLTAPAAAQSIGCCKICSNGKACGDSCIARWKTCHKGKGCACNG